MNLEFSEDQKFVQHSARDFLSKQSGLDVCRKVLESPTATSDPAPRLEQGARGDCGGNARA